MINENENTQAPHHKTIISEYVTHLLTAAQTPQERDKTLTRLINNALQQRKLTPRQYWIIVKDETLGPIIVSHDDTMHPHGIRISSIHEPHNH
jgi:hypothetical protein